MSRRNEYNYSNFDNYDDGYNSELRRRPAQNRQTASNRPVYNVSRSNRRSPRRNRKRTRNRIIIVVSFILIIALLILLFSIMFKGCSGNSVKTDANISKETKSTAETTVASATANSSQAQTSGNDLLSPTNFITPTIEDNQAEGFSSFGIYVWNEVGYELFGSDEDRAKNYANTINGFADKFADNVTVYDMVVPNHTEMGLPQRIKADEAPSSSQADNIKSIYANLSDKVTPINAYNLLAQHNSEYIYFNSDHHWTGLGAYYAYSAFAQTTNQKVLDLKSCEEKTVEGFTGSFSSYSDSIKSDTVHYWNFPYEVSMDIYHTADTFDTYDSPYYQYAEAGTNTYGLFIMGDNQETGLTVLHSESENATEGKKIAVVKESYGNAFVPFLTNNYQEVHIVDFRYFSQNLPAYCEANGIDEVLFLNGVMSANTQIQLDSMSSLF